ncbi:MAG: hypothetical protein GY696_32605, partial [Gammaproteobacteria bacterium]|nr:hypothetical protein [Gammaproteobacteria bacterium]
MPDNAPPPNQHAQAPPRLALKVTQPRTLMERLTDEKPTSEEWIAWKKSFHLWLDCNETLNGVEVPEDQKPMLFASLLGEGGRVFLDDLAIDWQAPAITLNQITDALDRVWKKETHVLAARFLFMGLRQTPEMKLDEWIREVTRHAPDCKWDSIEAGKIEDQLKLLCLVTGLENSDFQQKLIKEDSQTLTFSEAVKILRTEDSILRDTAAIGTGKYTETVSSVRGQASGNGYPPKRGRSRGNGRGNASNRGRYKKRSGVAPGCCRKCGESWSPGHLNECPAIGKKCSNCRKKDHFAKMCQSPSRVAAVNYENDEENSEEYDGEEDGVCAIDCVMEENILPVSAVNGEIEEKLPSPDKRTVSLKAPKANSGVDIVMEMDSDSPCVFINNQIYNDHFAREQIHSSGIKFLGYGGGQIKVRGYVKLIIQIGTKSGLVNCYVTRDPTARPLVGRNAMLELREGPDYTRMSVNKVLCSTSADEACGKIEGNSDLDFERSLSGIKIDDLKRKFPRCFQAGIGKVPNFKVSIKMKDGAIPPPTQGQPRPVPIALHDNVEEFIIERDKGLIWEPVQSATWICHALPRA